ncbi:MAG: hypothetical protein SGJ24_04595 [Chloroflexota bacterium]|nr:hypothetical protein [Chloroflexota bacterium]
MLDKHVDPQAILAFFADYQAQYRMPPTIREIVRHIGASSTSVVVYHLRRLADDGRLAAAAPRASRRYYLPEPDDAAQTIITTLVRAHRYVLKGASLIDIAIGQLSSTDQAVLRALTACSKPIELGKQLAKPRAHVVDALHRLECVGLAQRVRGYEWEPSLPIPIATVTP